MAISHTNVPTNKLMEIINLIIHNNYTEGCIKGEIIQVAMSYLTQITYTTKSNTAHKRGVHKWRNSLP